MEENQPPGSPTLSDGAVHHKTWIQADWTLFGQVNQMSLSFYLLFCDLFIVLIIRV